MGQYSIVAVFDSQIGRHYSMGRGVKIPLVEGRYNMVKVFFPNIPWEGGQYSIAVVLDSKF